MVPTVVRTGEHRGCPGAGLTRRAPVGLPGRGPAMLCGRCTPKVRFASCTWVCYEVPVCDTSGTCVDPPTVAHGHGKMYV